jgi:hypothetical protein
MNTKYYYENLKERDNLEDLGVDERLIKLIPWAEFLLRS